MSLRYLLISFCLIGLWACDKNGTEEQLPPPNIIFIMTDDHAVDAISAYGSNLISTPHIDRIAKHGMQFDNAFVTNSICGPSRAVIMTGKFSHKNGFKSNRDTFDGNQATLPKYLQQAGYYTAIAGKWHLKSTPQGFDEYSVLLDQGEYYSPQFYNGTDTTVVEGYATNVITDKALQVLDTQKDGEKPIFLMIHHKAPHRNWMPDTTHLSSGKEKVYPFPETFWDDYKTRTDAASKQDMRIENMFLGMDMKLMLPNAQEDETGTGGDPKAPSYTWWMRDYNLMTDDQREVWDAYYGPINEAYQNNPPKGKALTEWKYQRYMNDYLKCVQSVDDNVGRVLDYLEENGLSDNTLVIYTSDQGFYLGEHGWYDKRFMYEPSFRTPLFMQLPTKLKGKQKNEKLVQNIDFAPTMLAAAGVAIPSDMQGESLLSLGDKKNQRWRDQLYYHYYQGGTWHFVEKHVGIRTERYKLIFYYDLGDWELYDLQSDPQEVNNLYRDATYKPLSDSLKVELQGLATTYEDTTALNLLGVNGK